MGMDGGGVDGDDDSRVVMGTVTGVGDEIERGGCRDSVGDLGVSGIVGVDDGNDGDSDCLYVAVLCTAISL